MVKISSAIIFGLILAGLVTLILVPILYSRALRRREKSLRLRGYVMRDQQLRQALLEEQKKKAAGSDPPNPSSIESIPRQPPARRKSLTSHGQKR